MKSRIRMWPLAMIAALLLVFVPWRSSAQSKSVDVLRRDGDITIMQNGDVQVVETWEVRFIGGAFTYAFRSIPYNRVEAITDWGVSENGRSYQESSSATAGTYTLESSGGETKITWYFSPTTNATAHVSVALYPQGRLAHLRWWRPVLLEVYRE